ncbi:ABC transporter substrate-binding protein [Candidatus Sororendozoicomonas aggregata]|uniref:ABC transporter substrate-binding protein n=1 Tax=Candidatus Sororendozoicomonas aggregata TaxID=3073239 RepID=UPI002ED5B003
MIKQLSRFIVLLLLIPSTVFAKNDIPQDSPQKAVAKKPATKDITVMLDWFINPNHGPIIIAQEKGFFEQSGVNVTVQEPADPSLPPKLVAAGELDLGVYYGPSLMEGASNGLPIAWVGTLIASGLDGIIVLDKSNITSVADLKGKTIGMSSAGNQFPKLDRSFAPYGFSAKDVKLVNVGWNLSSSLMTGRVDAITGAYRNFELNEIALHNAKGRMFYFEELGVPPYDELIFIANTDPKKRDDEAIRRFLNGIELGTQFITNHPEEAWEIFKNSNKKQLDNSLNKHAWLDTVAYLAKRPAAMDVGRYQKYADFLLANRMIEKPLDVRELMLQL